MTTRRIGSYRESEVKDANQRTAQPTSIIIFFFLFLLS